MPLSDQDSAMIRRYLLGRLTDNEMAATEQRLLTDDDFFEDFELTKDELVEEYVSKELTEDESKWLEQHLLASHEGKQLAQFAISFDRHLASRRPAPQKKFSWIARLTGFWNSQPILLRAAAALAVVAIVAVLLWPTRTPSPQSFATLTLSNTSSTRSGGGEPPRIKGDGNGLRLTLVLPTQVSSPARYRVELTNGKGETKTSEVTATSADSVLFEIPAAQLTRGAQVVTLSTINADGTIQRIPGGYHFTVE